MVTKASRHVEYLDLDGIVGADVNPKRHDLGVLGDSVRRFGFTEPAVLDERTGKLVAGHGRLDQLRAMKAKGDPPPQGIEVDGDRWLMPVLRGWASINDKEARAYLIASNRITERGGWDTDALITALQSLEGELVGVGFDPADLERLMSGGEDDDVISDPIPPDTDEQLGGLMYRIVIECKDEHHQAELLQRLEGEGLKCDPVVN